MLADTAELVEAAVRAKKNVLFEGAQGTLLDIDHGTYPFVTSSNATAGGACTGTGVGPTRIDKVVGLVKAYSTRVGGGPFPTELNDETGERLRQAGAEFGSVTGRPRRTGWLDLPAVTYAVRINGLDALALTKLDVLTGQGDIKVCVAYRDQDGTDRPFPHDGSLDGRAEWTPVYETLAGWTEPIGHARSLGDLPPAARAYVEFIAAGREVPDREARERGLEAGRDDRAAGRVRAVSHASFVACCLRLLMHLVRCSRPSTPGPFSHEGRRVSPSASVQRSPPSPLVGEGGRGDEGRGDLGIDVVVGLP